MSRNKMDQRTLRGTNSLAWLTALLSGGVLPLAFAPFELFWIAPLSLASLFHLLLKSKTLRHALATGWWFGVGLFGVGASWVQVSIQQFGGVNLPVSLLMTLLFVMAMALFIAGFGGLFFLFLKKKGGRWRLLLLAPLLWVLMEWVRSTVLGGFPWLLLGHTAPGTFYRGLAPLVGTAGASLYLSLIAATLLQLLREKKVNRWLMGWTVVLLAGGWGSDQLQWGKPVGEPLSVAMVQGNIAQEEKWLPENRHRIEQLYRTATEQSQSTRLVIWPETALPQFRHQAEQRLLQPMHQQLKNGGQTLLAGMPIRQREGDRYFNGMVALGADEGEYHKRHLVPFGEYLPMREWLGPLLEWIKIPMADFSAGESWQSPLRVAGQRIAPTICYEIAYPELALSPLPEAMLLVTISNDGWFGDSLAPHQHLQIARMRALESARPLLRATNTGITAVVGADGEIVEQIPRGEFGVLRTTVQPMAGETPYVRWISYNGGMDDGA